MSGREKDSENREEKLQSVPDGYIRRSTLLQTLGASVGIFGALLGAYRFVDGFREYVDRRIDNERNERINADNKLELKIYELWSRKR